jgi:ADP-heptose:LPS heptosyltransferase
MNVRTFLKMDRWLGVPLCLALSGFRRVFGRSAPDCTSPPRSIVFVKLAEQGATVLAYGALRRAAEMVGRENIYLLVLEENRFIVDVLGVIPEHNVVTISSGSFLGFATSTLAALARLRRLRVEAAVDMEFFSRGSAALAYLSGARRRSGFHAFFGGGPYRGNLMTQRLLYNPHLHTTRTFLSLVEALLVDASTLPTFGLTPPVAPDEPPPFQPTAEEVASVKAMLAGKFVKPAPLILLNANAGDLLPLRRWAPERYVELARRLLARFPEVCVGFTGAPEEAAPAAELVKQVGSGRCVCLAGKTTLRQLLVLYTLAEVLVTNDSGPAHFATLTPIRVVTLFGPETPALFAAQTPRNAALWSGIACSPCVNAFNNRQSPCRNNLCMQAITVEEVFEAACRAYEQRGRK